MSLLNEEPYSELPLPRTTGAGLRALPVPVLCQDNGEIRQGNRKEALLAAVLEV